MVDELSRTHQNKKSYNFKKQSSKGKRVRESSKGVQEKIEAQEHVLIGKKDLQWLKT